MITNTNKGRKGIITRIGPKDAFYKVELQYLGTCIEIEYDWGGGWYSGGNKDLFPLTGMNLYFHMVQVHFID